MICVAISKGLSQFITSLIAIIFRVQPLFALLSGALLLPQTPVVFVTPQTHKITKEIHITIYTSSSRCICLAPPKRMYSDRCHMSGLYCIMTGGC